MLATFKKATKILSKIFIRFCVAILLYIIVAFCLANITVNKHPTSKPEVTIYIKSNGVHTDIVMPVKNEAINWSKQIPYSNTAEADSSYNYLAMGWGDKGFYLETPTWGDLKFSTAFKAAFALGKTAIHTTYYQNIEEGKNCKKITISNSDYAQLIQYINNSFTKDSSGLPIYIVTTANYNNADAFYEANGSYSLFFTCNTWANKCLKVSNQKCCLWTVFDKAIFWKYQ